MIKFLKKNDQFHMPRENKFNNGCTKKYMIIEERVENNCAIGFEEKISISKDFDHEKIRIINDDTSFSISATVEKKLKEGKNNSTTHRFRYSRFFERCISKPVMKTVKGEVCVSGLFLTKNKE
ncbi:hypothetical protein NBO_508g0025 [Nosema bombycis CQ1]|jgi:hypothetical protein|uniref:SHSP domain-containing protein n=1 Tax=Nosema bombycis (strain CQ1 / CVCC 102059) TaxID=578461 RepID=R0M2B3_NOSB1|nr:hypothetical protein NBO_508g0025 [Nosema bombycis CQ1]|eukprot:EOB12174.1 hypothetical protein NBO_508g0025 [Nosema bombycis CQ1]